MHHNTFHCLLFNPFNLHQMRLAPKYRYSCPKWLTEICTFIIKCDTKLVGALFWMEGLTETGAPNPFICVRPRKREEWGRGGIGLQNAVALSPLKTRATQPSEHESHLMWSVHSSRHTLTHRGTHFCICRTACFKVCTSICAQYKPHAGFSPTYAHNQR